MMKLKAKNQKTQMNTKQIVLASRPKGIPQVTDFRIEPTELRKMMPDEVLLKPLYFSVDPYMRGRMNEAKSYIQAFQIDKPLEGNALATVIESKSILFNSGDTVMGMIPWSEKSVVSDKGLVKVDPSRVPLSYYLSILGMKKWSGRCFLTENPW